MPAFTTMTRGHTHDLTLWLRRPYEDRMSVNLESSWHPRLIGASVTFGGEEKDLTIYVGVYLFAVWLSFRGFISWDVRRASYARAKAKAERYLEEDRRADLAYRAGILAEKPAARCHYAYELDPWQGRENGFRIHDGCVWWSLWDNGHGWRADDRRVAPWDGYGWQYTWPVIDWLLGKEDRDKTVLKVAETSIAVPAHGRYPAARYPATVTLTLYRNWRTRWPVGRKAWLSAKVEVEGGAPHPGKGTAAHNCGEDALQSASTPLMDLTWQQAHDTLFNNANHVPCTWISQAANHFVEQVGWYRANYPR